jgi:hypothetical protein
VPVPSAGKRDTERVGAGDGQSAAGTGQPVGRQRPGGKSASVPRRAETSLAGRIFAPWRKSAVTRHDARAGRQCATLQCLWFIARSTKLPIAHPSIARPDAGTAFPAVQRVLTPPACWPPTLVVVIDTEEEFDWSGPFDPASTAVTNIAAQPLAQDVFDRQGVVPTYVVDYPVATAPEAVAVLRGFAAAGRCEIGAHLHPWVTPPAEGPIDSRHSYPGNLSPALERKKLAALTEAIAASFGKPPTVYKAGRYGLGAATPATLRELGYAVDVSVVPHTDFSADGGPDFSEAPADPFMIDDGLCEIPLSVSFVGRLAGRGPRLYRRLTASAATRSLRLVGIFGRLGLLERLRLTPEGHSLTDLIRQTRAARAAGTRLFMLTYHSSSLLPGATNYVRTDAERSAFLSTLDGYLRFFRTELGGRTDTVTRVAAALAAAPAAAATS